MTVVCFIGSERRFSEISQIYLAVVKKLDPLPARQHIFKIDIMKKKLGREKDIEDIAMIEKARKREGAF